MELIIREAEEKDLEAITEMEKLCFPQDPWSYGSFYNEIVENDRTIYLIAEADGIPAGYMGIWEILDEGHITNVAVSPSFRRNHIAEALIKEILRITEEDGVNCWTLEV